MTYKNILIISWLCVTTSFAQAEKLPISKDYWKSSSFLKEFNGSYRINANIEPSISGEERALLVSIQSSMAAGNRKTALAKLQASKYAKTSAAIQFNIGNLLSEEAELDKAIEQYKSAIKLKPSFRRAQQNIAYAYARKNDLESAYPYLLEVVRLGGNDGSVMGLLANYYQSQERYQAALLSFQKAQLTQPEVTEWKLGTAYCLQQLGENNKALVQFQELEKVLPGSKDIKLQLANLHFILDQKHKAIVKLELLRRLKQLEPVNELWLGTLYLSEDNISLASSTLKRVLEQGKVQDFSATFNAIRYSLDIGQLKLAQELLDLVDKEKLSQKDQTKVTRTEAQLNLKDQATVTKGVELLKSLIQNDPTDVHSQYLLAVHYSEIKAYQEAIILLEQALLIDSNFQLQLYTELAKANVALKQYDSALAALQSYLDLEKSDHIQEYHDAIKDLATSKR